MPKFTGSYQHALDQKNRLFIPAKLREKLGDEFYSYIPINGTPCIMLFSEEKLDEMLAKLKTRYDGEQLSRAIRKTLGNTHEVAVDKQGRITLKAEFCKRAQLDGVAQINGVADLVEIWKPADTDAEEALDDDFSDWDY